MKYDYNHSDLFDACVSMLNECEKDFKENKIIGYDVGEHWVATPEELCKRRRKCKTPEEALELHIELYHEVVQIVHGGK